MVLDKLADSITTK